MVPDLHNKTITHFHSSHVPFDKQIQSWVITNITGGAVKNVESKMHEALGIIKKTLWHHEAFQCTVNDCMAKAKIEGSINERVFLATKFYELSYIANKDQNGDEAPTWLLTRKPITDDDKKHREYLKIICGTKFFMGIHALLLEKKFVSCIWCKSNTHPGHQCPLPKVDDWRGPKPPNKTHAGKVDGSRGGARRGSSHPNHMLRGNRGKYDGKRRRNTDHYPNN